MPRGLSPSLTIRHQNVREQSSAPLQGCSGSSAIADRSALFPQRQSPTFLLGALRRQYTDSTTGESINEPVSRKAPLVRKLTSRLLSSGEETPGLLMSVLNLRRLFADVDTQIVRRPSLRTDLMVLRVKSSKKKMENEVKSTHFNASQLTHTIVRCTTKRQLRKCAL